MRTYDKAGAFRPRGLLRRLPWLGAAAALTLASTMLGAGVGSAQAITPPITRPAAAPRPILWVVSSTAIGMLQQLKPPQGLLAHAFARAYVLGTPDNLGLPTRSFTSYTALHKAAATLPGPDDAVLLDLEHWQDKTLTPLNEQLNSGKYEQLGERLVHAVKLSHSPGHLQFLTAPGVSLAQAICRAKGITCNSPASMHQHYLAYDLARQAGAFSDVVDIQAQSEELDLSSFQKFVSQAAAQAKLGNPNVKVVVGLSTDHGKQMVSGAKLLAAVRAVRGMKNVAGFWLNIPGKSKFCPGCGGPFPRPALQLLESIYG